MSSIFPFVLVVVLIVVASTAEPQFNLNGYGNIPEVVTSSPGLSKLGYAAILDSNPAVRVIAWTQKIKDLVELVNITLTSMSEIAVQDNPDVGRQITITLNAEIVKAGQILIDFMTSISTNGSVIRREKRAENPGDGEKAYNDVGNTMVESNKSIDSDKKKLSPDAQKKIDQKYRDGVKKCQANPCKAAAKALQDTDGGERQ